MLPTWVTLKTGHKDTHAPRGDQHAGRAVASPMPAGQQGPCEHWAFPRLVPRVVQVPAPPQVFPGVLKISALPLPAPAPLAGPPPPSSPGTPRD